jgi:SAM-dependent methyltransferase
MLEPRLKSVTRADPLPIRHMESGKILPAVLFVSHTDTACGVYQYGANVAAAIKKSARYTISYVECANEDVFVSAVGRVSPSAIIYNYYQSTLPWLNPFLLGKLRVPHIGILHEVTQASADSASNGLFDYHIAPDPTLLLRNSIVFKTGRLLPTYNRSFPQPLIPTIGSFGFGLDGKGFERLIVKVQDEYDRAIIRLQIPFAKFGDADGKLATSTARRCRELILKPGIRLDLGHDFLSQEQILDFLAQNTLNAFFYDAYEGRGLSSAIDYAMAVRRPIAITNSNMFRHVSRARPSICIEDSTIERITCNGFAPLSGYYEEWSERNFIWEYERVLDTVLAKPLIRSTSGVLAKHLRKAIGRVRRAMHKGRDGNAPTHSRAGDKLMEAGTVKDIDISLTEVDREQILSSRIQNVTRFNRILDNAARVQYEPAIRDLFGLAGNIMARKLPEANIQQAFVFDTVRRFVPTPISNSRILCVGSFEDSACAALKALGFPVEEIDPILNYDLATFCEKPSTENSSYEVIFCTSVLEHVKDDERFMCQLSELLAPGGVAILTCDYNDTYKARDPIPEEDFRMYTQRDFKDRILPLLAHCSLVGDPFWECSDPDFSYAGLRYTFATLVFRKDRQ